MKIDKKKIIIIATGLLAIIAIVLIVLAFSRSRQERLAEEASHQPEMMGVEEKRAIGIPEEMQIQVMARDEDGGIMVYKKIDAPEEIEAVAPVIIRE
jgi:hypothetical protein